MNIKSSFFALFTFIALLHGQDFDYPGTMPPPIDATTAYFVTALPFILEYESPIQIRITSAIDSTLWNCMAAYESTPFDIQTKKEPRVRADADTITNYGTANTKALCGFYGQLIVIPQIIPDALETVQGLFSGFGLDSTLTSLAASVASCAVTDSDCLRTAASDANYSPQIMASIVAAQVLDYLENDGWNADGSINRNGDGPCTANCRPYSDTTGYEPEIGDLDRWQPLEEQNGKGFFYKYDHVVPHIGFTARTKFTSRETLRDRSSPNPDYDYDVETQLVIDRLEELASDDRQKMLVEFFDNKLSVGVSILLAMDALIGWTYEERIQFIAGYTASEYEAIIHAWREKRIWDMVRPTTLIKDEIAGDRITTYGGPYQGVQTFNAVDFESYIRVMPHSEYPSGSGCICLAATQYVAKLLEVKYGITDPLEIDIPFPGAPFLAGSSQNEPGSVPANDLPQTLSSLKELNELCGESRLWGGMHFTASIQGAWDLCDGVGEEAYDFIANVYAGNADAFGDEEEIPDFEEEYELEIKAMRKKLKDKKSKDKKSKDKKDKKDKDMLMPLTDIIENNNDGFYFVVGINIFVSVITTLISILLFNACCKKIKMQKNVKYEKVSKNDEL